jgi:membrane-associated protease RseP (regulator of RpoE activity)
MQRSVKQRTKKQQSTRAATLFVPITAHRERVERGFLFTLKILAFFTLAIGSTAGAEESIVERLQNTGVKVHAASKNDALTSHELDWLDIPYDWKCTDQSIFLVRQWIAALDTPAAIYVAGPRDCKHERIEKLKVDFPLLTVRRASAVFLGVMCPIDPFPCKVGGFGAGSPAESAGLMKGDVITGVNETAIKNFEELRVALFEFLPEEVVVLHVRRDSQDLKVTAKLAPFPLPPA